MSKITYKKLTLSLEVNSKHLIKDLVILTLFKVVSPKKIISSIYYNRLTSTILSPTKNPFEQILFLSFVYKTTTNAKHTLLEGTRGIA